MNALEKAQALAEKASLKSRPAQRKVAQEAEQKKFAADFKLVAEHFGFTLAEIDELRELAKTYDETSKARMRECYALIANSLRNAVRADGINQRIRASIEAEKRKVA